MSATRVGVLLALLTVVIVLAPLLVVLAGSLWSAPFIRMAGTVTLDNYITFLTAPKTGELIFSTLQMTVGAALFATVLGALLAWIVARTDIPFRNVVWWLPTSSLLLTGLLRDIAWIELYSPKIGMVNLTLQNLLGLSKPPFDIFSMAGLVASMGFTLTPIPYLIMLGPLTSMNRSLEEASRASGAGQLRTLRYVILPLLQPALLSGLALTAIIAAHSFETPVIIGLPGGINTYMSMIYGSMSTSPNYSIASAQSMVYLAFIGLLLWWYQHSTRVESRFSVIAGRGHNPGLVRLGPWRYVCLAIVLLHFWLSFGQLLAAAAYVSLLPYYTVTRALPPPGLDNYIKALTTVGTVDAIKNSLMVAAQTSVLCVIIALISALVAFKTRIAARRMIELVGTVPIAFPPLVFSVALLITFLSIPGMAVFYNTAVPLLVSLVVVFLPYALRVLGPAIIAIDNQLLEASASSGAGTLRTVRSIIVPLLAMALTNSVAVVFILSFRELGAIALVVPPGMNLMPTQIFGLWQSGEFGAVNALNVVSFVLTTATLLAARVLSLGISRGAARLRARENEQAEKPTLMGVA